MIRVSGTALLLAMTACSGGGGGDQAAADPIALVSLATAQTGAVAHSVTVYGAIERGAGAEYTLAAPAEAILVSVRAPVGTAVGTGQVVAVLRPTPATQAALASAASEARTAAAALARARRLRTDGLASDADVESARTAAESARARQASLLAQVRGLELRAPGTGHVQTVAVNPGDIVAPGATVATISRTGGGLRARFGVDLAIARRLSPGMPLTIAPSGGGTGFAAPIISVDPTVDPQTRLASVFAQMPPRADLGQGQPLTAEVPVAQARSALTIPYQALLDDGGQPYVYVVEAGVARRHDVTTGPASGNLVAISSGLTAGDKIVTQGGTALEDGMKVRAK